MSVGKMLESGKRSIKIKHPGREHERLGVPQGQKIPKFKIRSELAKDKASGNVTGEREDLFALNFGKGKK